MIIDFQHHYTPIELAEGAGESEMLGAHLDENGNPAYLMNPLLSDLDAHITMMDKAGIDAAVLSCPKGYDNPDRAACAFINDRMKAAEEDYPGRFIGLAHLPVFNEADLAGEIARCADELNFPGIVIGSELQDRPLDDPALDPLWRAASERGMYVFVHPLAGVINWNRMDADDLGRTLGWEFSLVVAALRMINGGVLDRFPDLKVQFAHFAGGIGRYMSRIRGFSTRVQWGTAGNPRHGRQPVTDIDYYINHRLFYDNAGWVSPIDTVRQGVEWTEFGLKEVSISQIVFATDYPMAIRTDEECTGYVEAIRYMGAIGERILSGNAEKLIPDLMDRVRSSEGKNNGTDNSAYRP
jgi:aminocarboxymuconate-semialdehyde decarboxylase